MRAPTLGRVTRTGRGADNIRLRKTQATTPSHTGPAEPAVALLAQGEGDA